jgi:hypothetical protein
MNRIEPKVSIKFESLTILLDFEIENFIINKITIILNDEKIFYFKKF